MTQKDKDENDLPGAQDQGGKHGGSKDGPGPTPQPDGQVWDEKKGRPTRPDHVSEERPS
jgi:hypothetical protein